MCLCASRPGSGAAVAEAKASALRRRRVDGGTDPSVNDEPARQCDHRDGSCDSGTDTRYAWHAQPPGPQSTDITMSTWPSAVKSCFGVSEVERGNHTDLLEEVEEVELVPVLDELAVLGPPDVNGTHLDRVACRRHTVEGTIVSAP